jgi:hypothetical protein
LHSGYRLVLNTFFLLELVLSSILLAVLILHLFLHSFTLLPAALSSFSPCLFLDSATLSISLKMAPRKEDSPYLDHVRHSIESIDLDLEDRDNDSETTLASDSFLAKQDPLNTRYTTRSQQLSKAQRLSNLLTWIRWGVVVLLQGVIILLLLPASGVLGDGWSFKGSTGNGSWEMSMTETGGDVNGIYVPSKFSASKFLRNTLSLVQNHINTLFSHPKKRNSFQI